jgi:hypothetical protein
MVGSVAQVPHKSCPRTRPGSPREGGESVSWGSPIRTRVPWPVRAVVGSIRRGAEAREFQPDSVDGGKRGKRGVRRPGVSGPGRGGTALRACLAVEGPAIQTGDMEAVTTGDLCQVVTRLRVIHRGERTQTDGARMGPLRGVPAGLRMGGHEGARVACFAYSPSVERVMVNLEGWILLKG